MCTLLGHNPFHYSVIQLQSFFPYICEEMKKPLPGVPLRCSFRKCTSTSYCIAFTGTSTSHHSGWSCNKPWSDGTGALPYVGTPRPTSNRAPKMARRAPKSTTASSQVREAAKRITTSDVGVLIWTELRRSCAAEHLVHTGRSSCECWNRLKGWYFCFWPKIFILEICYRELWARALLRVLCRTSCGLPSWALLLAPARPQSSLY